MGLQINTNVAALNAYRNLSGTQTSMQTSLERLSSGLRINRAADDAAGLAISEKLRSQVSGLNQAQANAQDGVSLIQTAEGALNETHSILQRMRTLTVQSASDTYKDEDRAQIQKEMNALAEELNGIASRTQFNKMNLLDGTFTGKSLQIGANEGQSMTFSIASVNAKVLGVGVDPAANGQAVARLANGNTIDASAAPNSAAKAGVYTLSGTDKVLDSTGNQVGTWAAASGTTTVTFTNTTAGTVAFGGTMAASDTFQITAPKAAAIDVSNQPNASNALSEIDAAIETVSGQRADLGALQNRLTHTINNLGVSAENLAASESRIRDTDMAKEMTNFTRSQILQQAGVSMLAQANQSSQSVLKLLG